MYQQFEGSFVSFLLSDNLSEILIPFSSMSGTILRAMLKACSCEINKF